MISRKQIEEMVSLAVLASKRINELRSRDFIEVNYKSDKSPVSNADFEANEIIVKGLKKICPGIPIVSEEIPESHFIKAETFFLIDPLDGTHGFLKGENEFTVNIALIDKAVPRIGILAAPALDQIYFNILGEGVYFGRCFGNETGFELAKSVMDPENHHNRVLLSKAFPTSEEKQLLSIYEPYQPERISSSIKFAYLAAGKGDIYPRFGPTKEWDTAAGHALLLASGGSMIELTSNKTFHYGKENYRNPPFLALAKGIPTHCE